MDGGRGHLSSSQDADLHIMCGNNRPEAQSSPVCVCVCVLKECRAFGLVSIRKLLIKQNLK